MSSKKKKEYCHSLDILNRSLKAVKTKKKLPYMGDHIKCGNSLISGTKRDLEIYFGSKWKERRPFNWESEFSEVFSQNGFDLVIGNPPYVSWDKIDHNERKLFEGGKYLDITYACRPSHKDSQPNYYLFFIVRAAKLLNENGILSFIIPQE
jgi:hypothetical protein